MIVWLASYPRSGNTLLRIILKRLFGLETWSAYDDKTDLGARQKVAKAIGHRSHGLKAKDFIGKVTASSERYFIKTHALPEDGSRAIYVVRDGRSALVSYRHYLKDIIGTNATLPEVIVGTGWVGSWSKHVEAWALSGRDNTLVIRFERLAAMDPSTIEDIARFIDRAPSNGGVSFAEWKRMYPEFFRSGSDQENIQELDESYPSLYSALHGQVAERIGYPRSTHDQPVFDLRSELGQAIASIRGTSTATAEARIADVARQLGLVGLAKETAMSTKENARKRKVSGTAVARLPTRLDLDAAIASLQAGQEDTDLVFRNGFFLFVFRNDWFYSTIQAADKNFDLARFGRRRATLLTGKDDGLGNPSSIERVLVEAVKGDPETVFLDVGANYGQWAIRARKLLDRTGLAPRTISFEPGLAARLTVVNFHLNGLSDIEFWPVAISDVDGIVPIFAVKGHSEDNRIVNKQKDGFTFPVASTRLDSILDLAGKPKSIFLKVDTQGAEFEVWKGLGRYAEATRDICAILEFHPMALSTRIKPIRFLEDLLERFHVSELSHKQEFVRDLDHAHLSDFIHTIWHGKASFCDIALIGRKHSRADALRATLREAVQKVA